MRNYFPALALGTYLVSWFTKVHTAQKGAWFSWCYGWEAFRVGLGPIWPGLNSVTSWSEGKPFESGYTLLTPIIPIYFSVPSALTNSWMICFALALILKKTDAWKPCLLAGAVACFCLNLFWFLSPLGLGEYEGQAKFSGLRPGYYLWVCSFLFAAVALTPAKESLAVFSKEVLRSILAPATAAIIGFAGFFKLQDLDRNLQVEIERRQNENKSNTSISYRQLSQAEMTPIPATSEKFSTPFLAELDAQIQANPQDAEAWAERAYLQAVLGNEAEAREGFKKALSLSTNPPSVYWSLGWALLNLGRFQDAEEAWSKAWTPQQGKEEPRWVPSAMAMVAWKSGKKNQALAWYQRAAEREPASFTTLTDLKDRISNWNTKEQAWLIEVHDAWQRTYLGRNSGTVLKNRLSHGKTNNSSCSTCR